MSVTANPTQDVDYQFTLNGSQVTGMSALVGGVAHALSLPTGAHLNVDGPYIMETLSTTDSVTLRVFAPEAGSTTDYYLGDVSTSYTHLSTATGGYAFSFDSSGAVTGEQLVETHGHGHGAHVPLPAGAVFTTWSGTVVEQTLHGNEVDTTMFTQPARSTLYAVSLTEQTYIDSAGAATALDVNPYNRMEFTLDTSGAVSKAQSLNWAGQLNTVAGPHVSFTALGSGYVEEVTADGADVSYRVYYQGQSANGVFAEVAHGSGSAVDLAGLQSQVHQAEQVLMTGATSPSATGWII